jgi:hypothetical protein
VGKGKGAVLSSANLDGQADSRRLARILGWLAAISLFAAGVITALLQFDITASPPRKAPPNDLLEGTLAFFQNESDRWPQQLTSLIPRHDWTPRAHRAGCTVGELYGS